MSQSEPAIGPASKPAVVLGLVFLIIGLAFALPVYLVPEGYNAFFGGLLSPEASNVYAVTAWAGWAHFLFAFRGQTASLSKSKQDGRLPRYAAYLFAVIASIALLYFARSLAGLSVFGAVVWLYFIDHFLKAERTFQDKYSDGAASSALMWIKNWQLLISFAWLSIVLLDVGQVNSMPWVLWGVSLALGALLLAIGGGKSLAKGSFGEPLLALFFVAEALVWGTYSRYGGPSFLTGVYVFHVAAGSFFHYLGSYFYAQARIKIKDFVLASPTVVAVNILTAVLGFLTIHIAGFAWMTPVFGLEWFTLWVGVHLVMSDIFPHIKNLGTKKVSLQNQ